MVGGKPKSLQRKFGHDKDGANRAGVACPRYRPQPSEWLGAPFFALVTALLKLFTRGPWAAYLDAVLRRPGQLVRAYLDNRRSLLCWAGPLLAVTLVLATSTLWLLQHNHNTWATIRGDSPIMPSLRAELGPRIHYWGIYSNLRQVALLPLYALPTWLVFRRQGIGYVGALLMQVLWNTAFNIYSLGFFGLIAGKVLHLSTVGTGFGLLLQLIYLASIGYEALDLRRGIAAGKALLTAGLVLVILRLLSCFGW